jgi:hypothetical protein
MISVCEKYAKEARNVWKRYEKGEENVPKREIFLINVRDIRFI